MLKKLYHTYERYIAPVTFLLGFTIDHFTLNRIDLWIDNLVILGYLIIAGFGIALINAYESGRLRWLFRGELPIFLPVLLQFPMGGLFSAFFIFYSRSGSYRASWPFLFALILLLIGNEYFRKRYLRFTFHASIYFVALFSYSILIVPILLHRMGADVFFISGLVSVAVFAVVVGLLFFLIPQRLREAKYPLLWSIGSIYVLFHLLYFTNIIPPIPLSLKESGIYHSLERIDGGYSVMVESVPWYFIFQEYSGTFHRVGGEPVYAYSAVFAPTKLDTAIVHQWSYYNEERGAWVASDRFGFSIIGGRDGGWRGYSFKENVSPGKWRVDVEIERGQLLGRMVFTVVDAVLLPPLEKLLR